MFRRFKIRPNIVLVLDASLLTILAFVGSYIGYEIANRNPPTQVLRRDLLRLTPKPLETFAYTSTFVRTKWCETKVNRWFVDSMNRSVVLEPLPYSTLQSESLFEVEESVTEVEIPYHMPAGPTEWCLQPEWKCNFTQRLPWPGPIVGKVECVTFWVNNPDIPYQSAR